MKWKESNEGVETEADKEGTFEENYSPLRTQKLNFGSRMTSVLTRPGSWMVIIPVLLLALLLFSMRSGGSDKALLSAMDQRLQNLESRMEALEGINELVMDLDNNRQAAQPLMVRLDRLETAFAKKISEMDQQLKELQTKPVRIEPKQAQTAVIKSQPSKQAAQIHVVEKGETLYSISKKYGVSVNQLMTVNKLSKGSIINPGQSLKIK